MTYTTAKNTFLRPRKEKWLSTFLLALATAAAFFIPYIVLGKGYFMLYGDFDAQQIPFYKLCHEAIRGGNMGWNWYTDLGANFIGSYAFYVLGSPFFWLTLIFPTSFVPYLMGPLLILKFGCAALSAYLYIRRFTKNPETARLGALLYAFSGFSLYNIFFNHFHEAIIVFPLLLWSLEVLITENRRGIFALMVTLCAITNYYFFFGMVVFCIIYFFVRLFSRAVNVRISRFLVLITEAVLGLLMASVLLLPAFATVMQNPRVNEVLLGWDALSYDAPQRYLYIIQSLFFPPDLPAVISFFPDSDCEWSSLAGWLPIFSMVGVFAYFKNHKKSWIKKLLGICALMAFIPILNSAFSAFNSQYYARWFYMPILIMCLATAMVSEDEEIAFTSSFKWVVGITVAFIVAIGAMPQKIDDKLVYGIYTQSEDSSYKISFFLFSLLALAGLFVLFFLIKFRKRNGRYFLNAAVACVCVITVIYGNCYMVLGRQYGEETKETMIDRLIEGKIDFDDDSFFRIDGYDTMDNIGMFLSTPSMDSFHSVIPGSSTEYYNYVGVIRQVTTRAETNLPAMRSLLSVKYVVNPTNKEPFLNSNKEPLMVGFQYKKTDGGYYIYENKNYIPMGFSYEYYMDNAFCDSYSSSGKTRLMLKAILLTDEQIKKYSNILTDVSELPTYTNDDIINGSDNQTDTLGDDQDKEEVIETKNETIEGTTLLLGDSQLEYDCQKLAGTSAYYFSTDNKGFTAKVKREKSNLVFFSVPYEEGWSCKVNGIDTEIEKVNGGFMAVKVPRGNSIIRFDYTTPGLSMGFKVSLGALLLFLIYFLCSALYLRNREVHTIYPEGDDLLDKWRKEDDYDPEGTIDGFDISSHSLLDEIEDIHNVSPPDEGGFEGGFTINTDIFSDKENKE